MKPTPHSGGSIGSGHMPLRWAWAGVVFALALAIVVCCVARSTSEVRLVSEPGGASVWFDGAFAGATPATLRRVPAGRHMVVMTKHGFKRWAATVVIKPRGPSVRAALEPAGRSSLAIHTTPSGATVLLNGTPRGSTPLTIDPIDPGEYRLRLVKRGFAPSEEVLGVTASQPTTVRRALDSRVERYYLQRLAENPDNLYDVIELGHHYVLENKLDKAEGTFKRSVHLAGGTPQMGDSERRLYTELSNVHSAQFDYGGHEVQRRARVMVVRVMEAILKAHAANVYAHHHLARMLAREGKVADAAHHYRQASRYTHDWRLRRTIDRELRKLGR